MIAHFQIREVVWNAFMALPDDDLGASNPNLLRMRNNGHYATGYWKQIGDFIVVNMIGPEAWLDETYSYFSPTDVNGYWKWNTNGKVDFATEYADQHNDILLYHDDHVTYDEDGNEIDRQPAAFDDPNWANGWAGQGNYRFARSVSRGFGGGFQ